MPTSTKGGELILPGVFPPRDDACMHGEVDPDTGDVVKCARPKDHGSHHIFVRWEP